MIRLIWLMNMFILLTYFNLCGQVPISLPVTFMDQSAGLKDTRNFYFYLDSKGFAWISSQSGLHRYDGSKVECYLPGPQAGTIHGKQVNGYFGEDEQSNIWFTTNKALNVYYRKTNTFNSFQGDTSGIPNYFSCGTDINGKVWLIHGSDLTVFDPATSGFNKICSLRNGTNRAVFQKNKSGEVSRIFCYNFNLEQIPGLEVVEVLKERLIRSIIITQGDQSGPIKVKDLYPQDDSTCWIIANSGLYKFNPLRSTWSEYRPMNADDNMIFRAVTPYLGDKLLVATYSDGLFVFDPASEKFLEHYIMLQNNQLLMEVPQSLYRDHQGGIWISVGYRGLAYFHPQNVLFRHYRHDLTTPIATSRIGLNTLLTLSDNSVWGSSNKHGAVLFQAENSVPLHYHKHNSKGITGNQTTMSFLDSEERIWLFTHKNISLRLTDGTIQSLDIDSDHSFESICEVQKGKYLLGSRIGGLFILEEIQKNIEFRISQLRSFKNDARYFYLNSDHDIIYAANNQQYIDLIGKNNGLSLLDRLPVNSNVHCIEEVDGSTWFGTDNGLIIHDSETNRIMKADWTDCLSNTIVYSIYKTSEKNLWISSNTGLFYLDSQNKTCKKFDIRHGVGLNQFNRLAHTRVANGDIWFGNSFGLTVVDPKRHEMPDIWSGVNISSILVNEKVDTVLRCAQSGSENVSEITSLDLPFKKNTLSFDFSALDYGGRQKAKYEYRMLGIDRNWVRSENIGFARYAGIRPGEYTFQVKTQNAPEHLVRSVALSIRPPVYLRWWFILLSTLLILGLLVYSWISYLRRKQKLQQLKYEKQLALEQERLRISNNLHDDLGSGLSALGLKARFVKHALKSEQLKQQLDSLVRNADEMTQKVRETIWTTNYKFDTLDNLFTRLHEYASEYLDNAKIQHHISLPELEQNLQVSGRARRQIYLAFKEGLHNIVKHSNASEVHISMTLKNDYIIHIEIRDNGIGFDPNDPALEKSGLKSMSDRMNMIGGLFSANSGKMGTSIKLIYKSES